MGHFWNDVIIRLHMPHQIAFQQALVLDAIMTRGEASHPESLKGRELPLQLVLAPGKARHQELDQHLIQDESPRHAGTKIPTPSNSKR